MRIALIDPRSSLVNSNEGLEELLKTSPHLYFYNYFWSGFSNALLTLASLAPRDTWDLQYIDENRRAIPYEDRFDIVALTATTQQATQAYRIAKRFKEMHGDNVVVVMGGPHATFRHLEALESVDVVFTGEADVSWPAFLEDFRTGTWRRVYRCEDFPPVDLSRLPVPRYDLLKPEDYRMIWIQTSRGCPRDCEFCSATRLFGRSHRTKRPEQVVEEIRTARTFMRHQQILFSDDNLLLGHSAKNGLLEAIRDLHISFVAQADVSVGRDREALALLKQCGCSTLFIGFESIDERNLKLINRNRWKMHQLEDLAKCIDNIIQAGIAVYGAFVIGYDWDTSESLRRLSSFITDNHLAGAQITVLTPLPGTRLRDRLEREGRVLETEWENYTFFDVNIRHPNLTKIELENELLRMYQWVYSPQNLAQKNRYYRRVYEQIARAEMAVAELEGAQ